MKYRSNNTKPAPPLTIYPAVTTQPISYHNHKGIEVNVPANEYIYVEVASGVALIGSDHVDIGEDEYRCIAS